MHGDCYNQGCVDAAFLVYETRILIGKSDRVSTFMEALICNEQLSILICGRKAGFYLRLSIKHSYTAAITTRMHPLLRSLASEPLPRIPRPIIRLVRRLNGKEQYSPSVGVPPDDV